MLAFLLRKEAEKNGQILLVEQEKSAKHYKGKFGKLLCFLKELAVIHKDSMFIPESLEKQEHHIQGSCIMN